MKKKLLLFSVFSMFLLKALAQTIPNGDFETWNSFSYEIPQNYVQSSNTDAFFKCSQPFNCVKTTDAYHGTYAVQLTTEVGNSDTCFGYFINGDPSNGNPSTWHGGIAYSQMPTGLRGYYKSAIATGDSGVVLVNFSKNGSSIGFYYMTFYGTHTNYTPFSFNFSPALSQTPDSVMFGVTSSDVFDNIAIAGSTITVDSVSFTGASQPATLNGDFEAWQTTNIDIPVGWFINSGSGEGFFKSTDAYSGTYALEMQTYQGDRNGVPRAQSGNMSTGYYICPPSSGPCTLFGGEAYSNTMDTLSFYYKYAPSSNDSAEIDLNFKYTGSTVSGFSKRLGPAASYQYMEMPFSLGSPVDTAVIQMFSSIWADSSTTYIGSDLKIDQLQFKSQPLPTGINSYSNKKAVSVYPNPSSGIINIQSSSQISEITITNILGEKVYSASITNYKTIIDFKTERKGIYFYELKNNEKVIEAGKLLIQ